jgi:hypothetical protein
VDKYYGVYKAKVIDNNDPKKINRVKIRVNGLMDGIPNTHLPWAFYNSPFFVMAHAGAFIRPPVNSFVSVWFADGELHDAYYTGGIVEASSDLPDNANQNGKYVLFESPDKHIAIVFNDITGKLEIKTGDHNTDLDSIVEAFLNHTAFYMPSLMPVGVSMPTSGPDKTPAIPPIGVVPNPYTDADFSGGSL